MSQAILTPKPNTVAKGLVWGLRNYLVERSVTWAGCVILDCEYVQHGVFVMIHNLEYLGELYKNQAHLLHLPISYLNSIYVF